MERRKGQEWCGTACLPSGKGTDTRNMDHPAMPVGFVLCQ